MPWAYFPLLHFDFLYYREFMSLSLQFLPNHVKTEGNKPNLSVFSIHSLNRKCVDLHEQAVVEAVVDLSEE